MRKNMFSDFKTGWCLMKTTKTKPTGYKGFTFTLYDKDDITVLTEVRAKTAIKMRHKIMNLLCEDKHDRP